MRVVFFEDNQATQFAPIALMRPVFELMCGCFSLRQRVLLSEKPEAWGALVRTELKHVYKEEHPTAIVNDPIGMQSGDTLLINGRWLPTPGDLNAATSDNVGLIAGQVAWLKIDSTEALLLEEDNWNDVIGQIAQSRTEKVLANGVMLERPWDLITHNPAQLTTDYENNFAPEAGLPDHVVVLGDAAKVSIHKSAEIDPYVVLDARTGPIRIEAGVKIQSFTRIEGPCFIGERTQLFRALIREGTTIGPVCRVGGEIEECIFQGYSNKYHEGFLGHSYVCPWVNIGAMSTTSDLKSDYSDVKVPLEGTPIDSGSPKIGSFIGDHAKTAINSMFNTGSSIGVMAMVLPGGPLLPKFIPSFSMIWFGEVRESWDIQRSLETAKVAMGRRDCEFTRAQADLIRFLHNKTASNRASAVERAALKASAKQ
jgi:UDP-N-acetylglucosamine diphosphorylase/glucosamine-1-phosphate N-acetyltransferase